MKKLVSILAAWLALSLATRADDISSPYFPATRMIYLVMTNTAGTNNTLTVTTNSGITIAASNIVATIKGPPFAVYPGHGFSVWPQFVTTNTAVTNQVVFTWNFGYTNQYLGTNLWTTVAPLTNSILTGTNGTNLGYAYNSMTNWGGVQWVQLATVQNLATNPVTITNFAVGVW